MSNSIHVFCPSKKALILECAGVSLLTMLLATFMGYQRDIPLNHALIISALVSTGAFVFYYRRGSKKNLTRVVITQTDLTLVYSKAWLNQIPWTEITEARLTQDAGAVWKIDTKWKIELRDDGFDVDDWSKMADLIEQRLTDANVPCTRSDSLKDALGYAASALHR